MTSSGSKVIAFAEAARIWELYGFSQPKDLVLEDLALAMGVVVFEGPLDGCDARLVRQGKRGLIRVKQDIPEFGRKRFAVGHELGHWMLHKKVSQLLACTSEDMVKKYRASGLEVEASYFSSALLMPEHLFGKRIRGRQPTFEFVKELAAEFNTTLTANAVRFVELSTEFCAFVVAEKGKIRWGRVSEEFEEVFRLEPGTLLPPSSGAAALSRSREPEDLREVDVSVWLPDLPEDLEFEAESLIESSLFLEKYGQVLSLLWVP